VEFRCACDDLKRGLRRKSAILTYSYLGRNRSGWQLAADWTAKRDLMDALRVAGLQNGAGIHRLVPHQLVELASCLFKRRQHLKLKGGIAGAQEGTLLTLQQKPLQSPSENKGCDFIAEAH